MMDINEIFFKVDDFYNGFKGFYQNYLLTSGKKQRRREGKLSISEMMTIIILFHQSCYRHFKGFYIHHVQKNMKKDFPNLISYNRFIQLMPRIIVPLIGYLESIRGEVTGISYVDSTTLAVCHPKRINAHRVFKGLAEKSKSTMGWFYGFKLHLVVNDRGELISWHLSKGNVDDRKALPKLIKKLTGKLFGDKGYISKKYSDDLFKKGIQLITNLRSNMKNKFISLADKILLRKRFIIETINDQLKNISQIEHPRHRSPFNFLANLFSGLIAYQLQPKKPSLKFSQTQLALSF